MNYTIDQMVREASKIPPIPQAAQKALGLIRNPDVNTSELARVLSTDQVLSGQMLRWANSPFYGMKSKIVSVQQAIIVLGLNDIQEILMSYAMYGHLNRSLPGYQLQGNDLWQHALGTAIGARLISKRCHLKIDDEAYFAGLLCDIGKLVFERFLRGVDTSQIEESSRSFLEFERNTFGIDHAILGTHIARHWQLPENLVTAIGFHHSPQYAENYRPLVDTIHVADAAMMMMGVGIGIDGLHYNLNEQAMDRLKLTENELTTIVDQISDQLARAKEMFSIN